MWVWVVEADLHHFSSLPHLLSECDQYSWVPNYCMTCVCPGHISVCFFCHANACLWPREALCPHKEERPQNAENAWNLFFSQSTQVLESWTTKHQADRPLTRTLAWHYNTHVHTNIPNPRGMQIHPSPCPTPPPMHFLSPHTRLHLPVSMLLRLTSGQQEPCPFPCSAPVRHLTTTLQQTFPGDESEMSVAFGT